MNKLQILLITSLMSFSAFSQQQSLLNNKFKVYEDNAVFTLLIRNDEKLSREFFIELDGKKSKKPIVIPPKKEKRFNFRIKGLISGEVKKFRVCTIPKVKESETLITRICSIGQVYRY